MGDLTTNLSKHEFKCKCNDTYCRRTPVDFALPGVIQNCIDHFAHIEKSSNPKFERVACTITSGHRCFSHNNKITDGKGSGVHVDGMGADHIMAYVYSDGTRQRIPDNEIADFYEYTYPDKFGIGRYPRDDYTGRTHLDVREQKARWTA